MKANTRYSVLLGTLLALGLTANSGATLVTVNSTETWDGTNNPHASDGVTVSGSGTVADPYTYNIPNGMLITSASRIKTLGIQAWVRRSAIGCRS